MLSIACGMRFSIAAHEVCKWCLDSFKDGYLYLPGIHQSGQRSARILLHNVPRQVLNVLLLSFVVLHVCVGYSIVFPQFVYLQGRLSGNHLKNCAVVCQAVDLALLCKPQQLLLLIGDALTDTEGQQLPEFKRRRGRGKHVHLSHGVSSLSVSCYPNSCLQLNSFFTVSMS